MIRIVASGSHRLSSRSRVGHIAIGVAAALLALAAVTAAAAHVARAAAAAHGASAVAGNRTADPPGTHLLTETFTGVDAPDFTGYNEACLRGASTSTPAPGDHSLGGCEATEVGPVPPNNAAPLGYLRLTDAGHDRTAAALFNHPLPATEGLDVTFQSWQYGSTTPANPADGISFFLVNGDVNLTAPGAFGGSLGYAKKQQTPLEGGPYLDGIEGGYLGIGLDVLGNYFADTEQRGTSCEGMRSPAGQTWMDADYYDRGPNMITVRGPGNGFTGYCYITATTNFPHSQPPSKPWPSNLPGNLQGSLTAFTPPVTPASAQQQLESDARTVNVRITPAPDPQVIISIAFGNGAMHQVLDFAAPTPVPATYKFGFAASTGAFTDVHLIRNVVISTDEPLPQLDLVKQVAEPVPANLGEGDQVQYQFMVRNSGDAPITGLEVHDATVGPVTCPQTRLDPGAETICTSVYTVTAADVARGFIANTAVATGEANGRAVESPPSSEHLDLTQPPSLALEKLAQTPGPYRAGQTVQYSYTVTNTGGVTVDDLGISDDHVTGITCALSSLAPAGRPGDSTTCRGTYVITAADAFAGLVTNTAQASGFADGETITSNEDQETLLIGPPRLTISKSVLTPGPHFKGNLVQYQYVVTNTGPLTLENVVIVDDHVARVTCGTTTLAPGESTTCTGTYQISPTDAAARQVTNVAQAYGMDGDGNIFVSGTVAVTIPVVSTPVTG
jgi:uncharacterized repeat protein (TIGR01451 family)